MPPKKQKKFVDENYIKDLSNRINNLMQTRDKNNEYYILKVGNKYLTITDKLQSKIKNLLSPKPIYVYNGSDELIEMYDKYETKDIQIIKKKYKNKNSKISGAFFPYINKSKIHLLRQGIFSKFDQEDYKINCLILCFLNANFPTEIIEKLKLFVKDRVVPKKDLKLIAENTKTKIILHSFRTQNDKTHKDSEKVQKEVFDSKENKYTIEIGYINQFDNSEGHYFLIEDTIYSSYSIENYDSIKDEKEFHNIVGKTDGKYKRSKERKINTMKAINIMLKNKDTFFTPISLEQHNVAATQYYSNFDKSAINAINHDSTKDKPIIPKCKKEDQKTLNIFFDFETYAHSKTKEHIPYLCAFTSEKLKLSKSFRGEDCGLQMLKYLLFIYRKDYKNYIFNMIAHNVSYDFNFIVRHLTRIDSQISNGKNIYAISAQFNEMKLYFKDSYKMISSPLSEFGNMFKLDQQKEIMCYDIYNEKTIIKESYSLDKIKKKFSEEEYNLFIKNVEKWNLLKPRNRFNHIEYSQNYCIIDCEVLEKGYNKFSEMVKDAIKMEVNDFLTSAALADNYLINELCYEGCFSICGIVRMFIQSCVVGGRCMTADNKPQYFEEQINDFDAVSLYPSAMNRIPGFLKGHPKLIENIPDYIALKKKNYDGYFVEVEFKNGLPKKRAFPLLSYVNKDGIRIFSNDVKTARVDKFCLEDVIKYHEVKEEDIIIKQGYYFNEGRNNKINEIIKKIFESRLKYKDEKNPIEQIFKLIMNSSYGKTILKDQESEVKIFTDINKFEVFLSINYNWIKYYNFITDKIIRVEMHKTIDNHYNRAHIGSEILSMSKRIMNEVMCLAEDNKINIYYQDTDSMHLKNCDIETLKKLFKNKYNRELSGENMGQFHTDFSFYDKNGVKRKDVKNIISVKLIALGKKCYIDKLRGELPNKDNIYPTVEEEKNFIYDYHIRLKGIPNNSIFNYVEKNKLESPLQIYENLYKGKKITFDLLCDGLKARFKFDAKNYKISSLSQFDREIYFKELDKQIKEIEIKDTEK